MTALDKFANKYKKKNKVLLFFSGGLDTSFLLHFFSNRLKWDVHSLFVDLGIDKKKIREIESHARRLGAKEHYTTEVKDEFINSFCSFAIMANSRFYGEHPLSSSISRPLISKVAVKIAEEQNIDYLMHGSNKYQNNAARYERSIILLGKKKTLSPVREQKLERSTMHKYLDENGIVLTKHSLFSSDENLWGREIEDYRLGNPSWIPTEEVYQATRPFDKAPKKPLIIDIGFKSGLPISINNKSMPLIEIVEYLNDVGGKYSLGRFDCMEDRTLGHKDREIHESPAAHIILKAHKDLEISILPRKTLFRKALIDVKWSYWAYQGFWFNKSKVKLDKEIVEINKSITGNVILNFSAGNCSIVGRKSKGIITSEDIIAGEKLKK